MAYQNCKPQSITPNIALGQTSVFWIAWHNRDHRIKEMFCLGGFSLPFPKPVLVFTVSLFSADLIESIKILRLNSPRCRLKVSLPPAYSPSPLLLTSCCCFLLLGCRGSSFAGILVQFEKLPQLQHGDLLHMQAWITLDFICLYFCFLFCPLQCFSSLNCLFPSFFFCVENSLYVFH